MGDNFIVYITLYYIYFYFYLAFYFYIYIYVCIYLQIRKVIYTSYKKLNNTKICKEKES